MKYIHVMTKEKFTDGIAAFYNHFFNNGEHEIIYFHRKNEDSLMNENLKICQKEYYSNNRNDIVEFLLSLQCDYIFLHSLFFVTIIDKIKILFKKNLMNKIIWIEWGADLYSWEKQGNLKSKLSNLINYSFRQKLKYVVCIFKPDLEYFKHKFPNSRAKLYYAPYTGYPRPKELTVQYNEISRLREDLRIGAPIYIQIGHNGAETLNHKKILNYLFKFKEENIRLVIPLSYGGTREYADGIEAYARKLFGDKVIILREFMPEKKYYELINKVSIAIFDTTRQCALGNINIMIFRNVKLYLSQNGVMYDYFSKNGIPVNKCEDICKCTYSKLVEPVISRDITKFNQYIYDISHIESSVEKWKAIFTDLKLRKKNKFED